MHHSISQQANKMLRQKNATEHTRQQPSLKLKYTIKLIKLCITIYYELTQKNKSKHINLPCTYFSEYFIGYI